MFYQPGSSILDVLDSGLWSTSLKVVLQCRTLNPDSRAGDVANVRTLRNGRTTVHWKELYTTLCIVHNLNLNKLEGTYWEPRKLSPYSRPASSILTQTPPLAYAVIRVATQTFSMAFLPFAAAHDVGGLASGLESISNRIPLNTCTIRAMTADASLYANCCPRQTRGPAPNGRNMNGLGAKYF